MNKTILLVLLICLQSAAAEREQMIWELIPFPGSVIVRDGHPEDGFTVGFLRLLESHLVGVDMQLQASNLPRVKRALMGHKNMCTGLMQPDPELVLSSYFVPLLVIPPMQVVIRRGELSRLPFTAGKLHLEHLLADPGLRGAIYNQRRYSADLEPLLRRAVGENALRSVSLSGSPDKMLQMLRLERFDYTFEYPMVVQASQAQNPESRTLQTVPLASSDYLPAIGVYCPRSSWGLRMIGQIDLAARSLLSDPQLVLQLYRRWMTPGTMQQYEPDIVAYLQDRALRRISVRNQLKKKPAPLESRTASDAS